MRTTPPKNLLIQSRRKQSTKAPCLKVSNESVLSTIALMETTNESGHLVRNEYHFKEG